MKQKTLIWTFILIALAPIYYLTWKNNHSLFLFFNGFWKGSLGYPMLFFTAMADGLFVLMISSLVYNRKKGFYWAFILSYIVTAIIVQLIKNNYSSGRPLAFYRPDQIFFAGEILRYQSFPSGHSSAAMVLARFLMEYAKSTKIKVLLFLTGCLCAFSRIYIGAHFPIDVLTGGLIGFFFTDLIFWFAAHRAAHQKRPEYKYNRVIVAAVGLIASISFVLFQREKYAQVSLVLIILAGGVFVYHIYLIIRDFFGIYKDAADNKGT